MVFHARPAPVHMERCGYNRVIVCRAMIWFKDNQTVTLLEWQNEFVKTLIILSWFQKVQRYP